MPNRPSHLIKLGWGVKPGVVLSRYFQNPMIDDAQDAAEILERLAVLDSAPPKKPRGASPRGG